MNLISSYDKVTHLADQGKPVNVIILDFSKVFDHVSHSTLPNKMSSMQIDNYIIQRVNNWLTSQTHKVLINGVTWGRQAVTSGVPQGFILGPVLINAFINGLDAGLECIGAKSADNTTLEGAVDSLRVREVLLRDLDK